MVHSLYLSPEGTIQKDVDLTAVSVLLQKSEGILWVDLYDGDIQRAEKLLKEVFHFHPLAIEDALEETHIPKVDNWNSYLYMVLYQVTFSKEPLEMLQRPEEMLSQAELDIFLGENYLVTYHVQPISALEAVWDSCQRDPRFFKQGAAYLLYQLTDSLVDSHFPVFDYLEERLEQVEDQILSFPDQKTLQEILILKRSLLQLRRVMMPQREVFSKLSRSGYQVIGEEEIYFFRDVYDHYVRLYDLIDNLRELLSGALDTYLSAINNRMNEVMKTLTVITTLFMPLAFITGFFGMNFFQPTIPLTGWTGTIAFIVMLGLMVGLPVAMLVWMRRQRWM